MDATILIIDDNELADDLPVVDHHVAIGERQRHVHAPHEHEPAAAVAQLITIADGLTAMAAHQPGFIHRRLDPGRMFIDATGRARLRAPLERVSFGPMCSYVGRGRVITNFGFFSPEQCRGMRLTQASDVFALAANLITALSGRPPFIQETDFATHEAIISRPPPPCPTYAPGLDRVLARAFAKQPGERYPDPAAFAAELYECVPEAGDHDAVVSDRIAAWRPTAAQPYAAVRRGPRCAKRWDDLVAGDDDTIRHCTSCQQHVVHVRSLAAAVCFGLRGSSAVPGAEHARTE